MRPCAFKDALFQKDEAQKAQVTAEAKEKEANRRAMVSLAQAMSFEALDQLAQHNGPLSALLERQAYLFHQQNQGTLLAQMDNTLRRGLDVFYVQSKTIKFDQPDSWTSAAFRPDGTRLIFINADNTVWLWDLAQLAQSDATPLILVGHEDQVNSIVFSSDGMHLASGSKDRTVRMWDLTHPTAAPHIFTGHESPVMSVAFGSDGKFLASGRGSFSTMSADPTVRV